MVTTTPPLDPVREKFEAWFASENNGVQPLWGTLDRATYELPVTKRMWETWQSAYASGHEAGVREERERCIALIEKWRHSDSSDIIQRIEGAK
jgi:hypothetical protein